VDHSAAAAPYAVAYKAQGHASGKLDFHFDPVKRTSGPDVRLPCAVPPRWVTWILL
jgi:hypothetical protein